MVQYAYFVVRFVWVTIPYSSYCAYALLNVLFVRYPQTIENDLVLSNYLAANLNMTNPSID